MGRNHMIDKAGRLAEPQVQAAMPHAGYGGALPEGMEICAAARNFLFHVAGCTS